MHSGGENSSEQTVIFILKLVGSLVLLILILNSPKTKDVVLRPRNMRERTSCPHMQCDTSLTPPWFLSSVVAFTILALPVTEVERTVYCYALIFLTIEHNQLHETVSTTTTTHANSAVLSLAAKTKTHGGSEKSRASGCSLHQNKISKLIESFWLHREKLIRNQKWRINKRTGIASEGI